MLARLRFSRLSVLSWIVAGAAIHGWTQRKPSKAAAVPMETYMDSSGGVSFEYPIVWKADTSVKFYIPPHILQGGVSPQAQVIFLPAGNYYRARLCIPQDGATLAGSV